MRRLSALLTLALLAAACSPGQPSRPADALKLATWNLEWRSERCGCMPESSKLTV